MKVHHTALCVRDVDASLRFWRDGLGFEVLMDTEFDGNWPHLFGAPEHHLRSVFLGDPASDDAGILELVDFGVGVGAPAVGPGGPVDDAPPPANGPAVGFLLVSVYTDVDAALGRLRELGLGGTPRRIEAYEVAMAVVTDPSGVRVELIDL